MKSWTSGLKGTLESLQGSHFLGGIRPGANGQGFSQWNIFPVLFCSHLGHKFMLCIGVFGKGNIQKLPQGPDY